MSDSWEEFVHALDAEAESLGNLHRGALQLTQALVQNDAAYIRQRSLEVEALRKIHLTHAGRRRSMQRRGFGKLTLRDACTYAPQALQYYLRGKLAELFYYITSLRITNENNRALVVSGMERLLKIIEVIRDAQGEKTGTYRRRGIQKRKDASVIMSQQA